MIRIREADELRLAAQTDGLEPLDFVGHLLPGFDL